MTEKDQIKHEVSEALQWAAVEFSKSKVPKSHLTRLNTGLNDALRRRLNQEVTPDIAKRVRNMLAVYKLAVKSLVEQ